MWDRHLNIGLVAGESSGDQLAAELLKGTRAAFAQVNAFGVAGDAMVAQGAQAWWPSQSLAVRGIFEPIRHLPRIIKMRSELIGRVRSALMCLWGLMRLILISALSGVCVRLGLKPCIM